MKNLHSSRALAGFLVALSAGFSYADTVVSTPIAGMEQLPQFPPSNTVLHAALNDLNRCIDTTVVAAADTQTATTTDAVMGKCATAQAQLKRMLPPAAYDSGVADTRQRVDRVLAAQKNSTMAP